MLQYVLVITADGKIELTKLDAGRYARCPHLFIRLRKHPSHGKPEKDLLGGGGHFTRRE